MWWIYVLVFLGVIAWCTGVAALWVRAAGRPVRREI